MAGGDTTEALIAKLPKPEDFTVEHLSSKNPIHGMPESKWPYFYTYYFSVFFKLIQTAYALLESQRSKVLVELGSGNIAPDTLQDFKSTLKILEILKAKTIFFANQLFTLYRTSPEWTNGRADRADNPCGIHCYVMNQLTRRYMDRVIRSGAELIRYIDNPESEASRADETQVLDELFPSQEEEKVSGTLLMAGAGPSIAPR